MSSVIMRAMSGGELDPVLWARADVTKYASGLRTLRNAYVRRNGGVQGKPGSTKIQAVEDSTKTVRLIPFIYSQTATYMMEFGDKYVRFYQNGAPYLAQGAQPYNAGTNYTMGQLVTSGGITYVCVFTGKATSGPLNPGPNSTLFGLSMPTISSVTPGTKPKAWYALTGNIYEIPTLWAYTDLPNLRFDQTGNDMVFTHPSYPQYRITRSSITQPDTTVHDGFLLFSCAPTSYMESTSPTNDQVDSNAIAVASAKTVYGISAVSAAGDEFPEPINTDGTPLVSAGVEVTTTNTVQGSATITLNWTAAPNAVLYNIYYLNKATSVFGFIGSTSLLTFKDTAITPDYKNPWVQTGSPLNANLPLNSVNNYPGACAFYQQRLIYGNTNNAPTTGFGSQTGLYDNFNVHVPSVATDYFQFKMTGHQDVIQHLLSLGTLLVFTYGTINTVPGDASGAISPASCGPHRESINGASSLRPLLVGEFALYGQSQGAIIRDLGFNFQVDGYRGDDLTVFATHLFDNYTITDWTYQSVPHSVVWAVRSDGTLLSLTYVREQQILGWAHHDTLGTYENVACIPEGNQVSVYVVVKRTINGTTTRFVERFFNQQFTDVRNFIGMDCATTIDGRNTTADTATLSGGTNWNEVELLTLTLNANNFLTFTSGMATNQDMIFLYDSSGNLYRFKITVFSSATVVQGFVDRTIPVSLRGLAASSWSHAISVVSGLTYLNGQAVSVFADGFVVGSPNNAAYPVYTVSGGSITLDKPYAVIQVGLPFISDIETLDIDTPGALENLGGQSKLVGEVTIYMVNSRTVFVGSANPDTDLTNITNDPLYRLTEQKVRQNESYDSPLALLTGKVTQTIQPSWDQNGHVFIRNVDPTPMLISAISPEGLYPMKVGG